ncbi:MAG: SDR family NAD(P)-dependent oxidoreductase [Bacteroidales bacterium]|nr:SDR family NAD(P)-dependent oxidoreductase [Bacteroidales bacterium]
MRPIAVVSGASAGFGRATAEILARNNYDVVITGRRADKLEIAEEAIRSKTEADVLSLSFDIRDLKAVQEACEKLTGKWEKVDVLVNNAGLAAGLSLIHEGSVDDWEQMIDTNIKGLLYMTRLLSPGMVQRGKGHIVNIGSIAGKEAYEMGNVYNASKFAVDGLTQAMRIDLVNFGIKVSAINPGAAETEFSLVRFKGDREQADKVYEGFTPLYAEDIAEAVLFVVNRPPHVNIDDLIIMPAAQARSRKIKRNNPK